MTPDRPGVSPLTQRSPRVVAARRLLRRRHRDATGLFLAEGPQAVGEAVAAGAVVDLFTTSPVRAGELAAAARSAGSGVWPVTEAALAALAETVTPQGVVAVCRQRHRDVVGELAQARLVVVLAPVSDPGNAGTVLRTADAAGTDTVVFAAGSVDPYNGKCVRASAGSLFHVDLVRGVEPAAAVADLRAAGLTVLAADPYGETDLDAWADAGRLAEPTAWVFGGEAHGLAPEVAAAADARVRVPIHGRAESLNLAAAAAVCLYASARAHRQGASRDHRPAAARPPV
jgi:TrmH family RNA methyltransferase